MNVEIVEENEGMMKVRIDDTSTLVNLLNENVWKQKVDYSAYSIDHPYMAKPVIVVKAKNPKKSILDAAEETISQLKDLKKQISASLK